MPEGQFYARSNQEASSNSVPSCGVCSCPGVDPCPGGRLLREDRGPCCDHPARPGHDRVVGGTATGNSHAHPHGDAYRNAITCAVGKRCRSGGGRGDRSAGGGCDRLGRRISGNDRRRRPVLDRGVAAWAVRDRRRASSPRPVRVEHPGCKGRRNPERGRAVGCRRRGGSPRSDGQQPDRPGRRAHSRRCRAPGAPAGLRRDGGLRRRNRARRRVPGQLQGRRVRCRRPKRP